LLLRRLRGHLILPKEFCDDLAGETTVIVIGTGEYLEMMKESDWRMQEEEIMNVDWDALLDEI
jgi:DNA-binding transcriptional regulator/RsmH inhibitor MraZ